MANVTVYLVDGKRLDYEIKKPKREIAKHFMESMDKPAMKFMRENYILIINPKNITYLEIKD